MLKRSHSTIFESHCRFWGSGVLYSILCGDPSPKLLCFVPPWKSAVVLVISSPTCSCVEYTRGIKLILFVFIADHCLGIRPVKRFPHHDCRCAQLPLGIVQLLRLRYAHSLYEYLDPSLLTKSAKILQCLAFHRASHVSIVGGNGKR